MKNILLITSNKNLNTLNYKNILSYLKKIKLQHEVIDTELEDISNLILENNWVEKVKIKIDYLNIYLYNIQFML